MGEDRIGLLSFEQATELFVMRWVNNGLPIDLLSELGPSLENAAGFFRFQPRGGVGGNSGAFRGIPAVQIKKHDLMAQIAIAGNRAATAVFWISGVTACDNDFESGLG